MACPRSASEHIWGRRRRERRTTRPLVLEDPPSPSIPRRTRGHGLPCAIETGRLAWERPSSRDEDIFGYQVLCARADGSPLYATPPDGPEYQTRRTVCNQGEDTLAALSPRWVCSGKIAKGATTARVDLGDASLAPDEKISVTLVAFDEALNPVGIQAPGSAGFEPVRDGWEHYDEVGSAEPGFCAVAVGGGSTGGALWLLVGIGALVWRGRAVRRAPALGRALSPPRWPKPSSTSTRLKLRPRSALRSRRSRVGFEIKLGPYFPPSTTSPLERTQALRRDVRHPQLDPAADRGRPLLLHPAGALGVG